MRRAIVAAALASGCDHPFCTPGPTWALPATAAVQARALADDTLVVLVTEVGPATLGGTDVDGPALARVSPDGAVLASVHLPMTTAATDLRVDDRGGIAVTGDNFTGIARYDATTLARVWALDAAESGPTFDIGPTGDVAFLSGFTGKLHYVDATGTERWTADIDGFSTLRLDETGGLFVLHGDPQVPSTQLRFDRTGAMLGEVDFPTIPGDATEYLLARDGSVVFLADTYRTSLARADATGQVQWSVPFRATTASPVLASNGDVLAATHIGTAAVRIDGSTGAVLAESDNCALSRGLVSATATGYVVHDISGLAAFSGP